MKRAIKNMFLLGGAATCAVVPHVSYSQTLEEVVVTATRRAQNIQDIPIAVTAVTPLQLERQGVDDLGELGNVSASFNLQSSQNESQGTSIRIRGIGTTGNNIGLESAVGVFIDGVYQSRPGIALGELIDLEGIEVLRGPQGTLFGRNTTAGAIVIKTAAPSFDEFSGFINSSVGNFSAFNVQGGLNIPVNDKLALRFTGAQRSRDGFLDSALGDGGESHDRDRYVIRGQALWEPNENVSVRIIADVQETDEKCCAAATLSTSPNLSAATTNTAFPAVGFEDSVDARRFNSSEFENAVDQEGLSVEVNWEIGESTLTYIGSYRDFLGDTVQDEFNAAATYSISGITFPEGTPPSFDAIETTTHELRLQGSAFNDRLDWMVGAYYSDEDIEEVTSLGIGADFSSVVSEANFGSPAVLGLVSAAGAFLASGGNPAAFSPISSDGAFATNRFTQEAESASIFTHLIYSATDRLDLTLGLRYVDDTKRGQFEQLAASNDACLASLGFAGALGADPAGTAAALAPFGPTVQGLLTNPAVAGGGAFINCFPFAAPALGISFLPAEFDEDFDDDELIYTLQAGYKASDDVLIYGGLTHGYKAGGFNLDSTAAASGSTPSFASEIIDSFELGVKSTLFGGRTRANLSIFYSELEDFQVLEFTGTQFVTFNVDDVTSQGVELEVLHNFSDTLSGDFAYTYTDAAYGSNCDRNGEIVDAFGLCGEDLTNAPENVIVAGLTYEGQLGGTGWQLLANIGLRYESDRRTSTRPVETSGNVITGLVPFDIQDSNTKVNARIGFTHPNDRLSFEFWGVNLGDEITRGITFNTPLQDASRSAFLADPRTYGITARYKF